MNKEIKNWRTGEIIIEAGKYSSTKEAVEKNKANLKNADLRGADLGGAYLWKANLWKANLEEANLGEANLGEANLRGADLWKANLGEAYLRKANLWKADLRGADLRGADLRGADLRGADLEGAYLRKADIGKADLWEADLWEAFLLPDLYILKLQPPTTKLRAWKYLFDGNSPYQNMIYEVGNTYTENNYDRDETVTCGRGLNVATLQWCLHDNTDANEFLEVEFEAQDIIAIPFATDGKFRVKKLKVIRKINREEAKKLLEEKINLESNNDH